MGTTLTGTTPQDTYDSLIKVTDNGPLSGTAKFLSDGLGNDSVLALSTTAVGIGTASAAELLTLQNGNVDNVSGSRLRMNMGPNPYWELQANNGGVAADRKFIINTSSTAGDVLTLTQAGNVGIGTSAPTGKLEVNGAMRSTRVGAASQYIEVDGGDAAGGFITMAGAAKTLVIKNNSTTSSDVLFDQAVATRYTFAQAGTQILRIDADGVKFGTDSAAANALDDYEEGTWTGTLRGSVSDPTTAVTATGRYTKIGRVVTVEIQMDAKDTTGASGGVTVTGLPFTSSVEAQGAIMSDLYTFGASCTASNCFVSPFSTTLTFFTSGSNASWASLTHNAGTPRSLRGTVTYFV